ncbi:uncharacterized protein LOC126567432 [Anopheles maculipalpis]|uniref:uncharacterized protein LOC126567432 n=1 Tax=Anopheles maculipalpis TaxID=1496333 RepID=UPI00215921E3|nr:uncharacterized protein LOC126567432 [Anopheles maculipalpis]
MDKTYHAIQAAMLEGNVEQLNQLLSSCNITDGQIHLQLSGPYAELKHRNIVLSEEMVHFVEYELVKGSYQNASNAYHSTENAATAKSTDIANRIAHMVQCIDLIITDHKPDSYTDIDEWLVLRLRHIYAHVFFLKTHLRKLPLLQLQFCIAVFLKLVTGKPINGFDVYAFTIDKERIFRFLKITRNAVTKDMKPAVSLDQYVLYVRHLLNRATETKLSGVPKRIRTFVQLQVKALNPSILEDMRKEVSFAELPPPSKQTLKSLYEKTIDWDHRKRSSRTFKELHETYFIMKQHYSLRKLIAYIDGMREGPCNDPPHKQPPVPSPTRIRAIKRTLQVIGEMIKSTRESPNITAKLNRILQLITSEVLAERTKDLRQFFSHGYSLAKWELEEERCDQLGAVFQKIEINLREARRWFVYTQTQQNLLIYRRYLAYLKGFRSIEALRSYIAFIGTEFKGSLIETYLPEQLTEAKLLVEYMLGSSEPTGTVIDPATRDDLMYIVKDLKLRIDAIRVENASLGQTIDEFFFLEGYIRQPTATLNRVQQTVDYILSKTQLARRHKLVQKTDLMYARELLTRLQMAETDETRRYMWSAIWTRLSKEQFGGLDTLLERTEHRVDVALDATVKTIQALHLPLEDDEYVQFVNRRLAKSYYENVFVLDNKYRVLKEIVKDRRAQQTSNVRGVLEKLKELRKEDEHTFQHMFDGLLDSMKHILGNCDQTNGILPSITDQLALEYCLLEASEILCSLALFRDNTADLATMPIPVITGRNLRNYLAHDMLAYDTLTACANAVVLNARYLVENRFKLYGNSGTATPRTKVIDSGEVMKKMQFQEIFQHQTEWTHELVEFFQIIKNFQTAVLQQRILGAKETHSSVDLLLMGRNFLDQEIVSIALSANPSQFAGQLLNFEANSSNFFHILIEYFKNDDLVQKIRQLIHSPKVFCTNLALKYGLIDVLRSLWYRINEEAMKSIITTEMSTIFMRHSSELIRELVLLFPATWFVELEDHLGNTLLHWTVLRSDLELLQFVLCRFKMLFKTKNKFGDVPLLIAVRYHADEVVQLLLDHGADPWIEPKIVQTLAIQNRQQLLQRFPVDIGRIVAGQAHGFRNNPLRAAIEANNYELFVTLHKQFRYELQKGDLLHLAARLNRVQFLEYILTAEGKIAVDSISQDISFTPLMVACASGHFEAAQLLLLHGADGLFHNENNTSPWHCAVHGGKRNILSLLLSTPNMNVNAVTRDKRSALSIAIESDQTEAQINFLLTTAGVTVGSEHVLHASLHGKRNILKLLINRQPEHLLAKDFLQRSPLMIAVILNDATMTQYLLDRGADRNTVNLLGMNCLHVAALNNLAGITKILLAAQVDYEAEDNFGRTPLVVALEAEHLTIVEQLINGGASPKSVLLYRFKNHRNATLLHKFTLEKRPRMIEYLIKKLQFPTDLVDDDGKTAEMLKGDDN